MDETEGGEWEGSLPLYADFIVLDPDQGETGLRGQVWESQRSGRNNRTRKMKE